MRLFFPNLVIWLRGKWYKAQANYMSAYLHFYYVIRILHEFIIENSLIMIAVLFF